MNLIRSLISLLFVTLVVLSVLGIVWWDSPPEPLAGYTSGGKAILGVLIVAGLVGLWRLWAPVDRSNA